MTTNLLILEGLIEVCQPYADLSALRLIQQVDSFSVMGLAIVWGSALNYPLTPAHEITSEQSLISLFVAHCRRSRSRPLRVKPYGYRVLKAREAALLREKIKGNHHAHTT